MTNPNAKPGGKDGSLMSGLNLPNPSLGQKRPSHSNAPDPHINNQQNPYEKSQPNPYKKNEGSLNLPNIDSSSMNQGLNGNNMPNKTTGTIGSPPTHLNSLSRNVAHPQAEVQSFKQIGNDPTGLKRVYVPENFNQDKKPKTGEHSQGEGNSNADPQVDKSSTNPLFSAPEINGDEVQNEPAMESKNESESQDGENGDDDEKN